MIAELLWIAGGMVAGGLFTYAWLTMPGPEDVEQELARRRHPSQPPRDDWRADGWADPRRRHPSQWPDGDDDYRWPV